MFHFWMYEVKRWLFVFGHKYTYLFRINKNNIFKKGFSLQERKRFYLRNIVTVPEHLAIYIHHKK